MKQVHFLVPDIGMPGMTFPYVRYGPYVWYGGTARGHVVRYEIKSYVGFKLLCLVSTEICLAVKTYDRTSCPRRYKKIILGSVKRFFCYNVYQK